MGAAGKTPGAPRRARRALPRPLVLAGYPLLALLLTAFFVFLGFPYDLLASRLSAEVERTTQMRLRIGELSPHIGVAGLGLAATDVLAGSEDSRTIVLQQLVMRPAWSFSWFRGAPALRIFVTSEIGSADGTITMGEYGGWSGTLSDVQLSYLPLGAFTTSVNLEGLLTAEADVHSAGSEAGGGLVGTIEFALREGSLSAPDLPMSLPFDQLAGRLVLGDGAFLRVEGVELAGPLVTASVEGTVADGPTPPMLPLDLKISYVIEEKELASMLGSGVGRAGSDGRTHVLVSGTVSQPVLR